MGTNPLHGNNEVFQASLFLSFLGRFAMHDAIETSRVLEEVVNTRHNAEDTESEHVDTHNSDDTRN